MTPVKKALGPALLVLAVISLLAALLFSSNTPEPNPHVQSKQSAAANLLRISGIVAVISVCGPIQQLASFSIMD